MKSFLAYASKCLPAVPTVPPCEQFAVPHFVWKAVPEQHRASTLTLRGRQQFVISGDAFQLLQSIGIKLQADGSLAVDPQKLTEEGQKLFAEWAAARFRDELLTEARPFLSPF